MSQLHVAIVGGGITGLILAIGLRARGVACTVYERAAAFAETGAGIGLSPNAEVAMQLLDPAVHAAFQAAVTPNGEDYFQWVDGCATDALLFRLHLGKDGFQGGRRSEILQAWVALVPPATVQFGKSLVGLVDGDDAAGAPVQLQFADGSTATADVGESAPLYISHFCSLAHPQSVIGCDGVWSRVRSLLFGDACRATYSHQYCFRAVVPMAAARAAIGDHRASTRFMYNGRGAHSITYPVAKGAMLNVLVVVADPNPWAAVDESTGQAQTTGTGSRRDAEDAFREWQPCARGVVGLLPDAPDRWAIFDMLEHPAPLYAVGRVAVAGDAAHASGPHLGAGAGFGIEDALVLATLLGDVAAAGDARRAPSALAAYSAVRYDRTQWLVQASREAVDWFQGRDAVQGQDAAAFGQAITALFHRIWHYDMEGMLAAARNLYEEGVEKA